MILKRITTLLQLVPFPEDLGLIPGIQIVVHNHLFKE